MGKETPQNDSSEDGSDFWELAGPEETIECPNCSADMELMTVYKDDGTVDHQVFYCWQCDNAVPSDYDPSDEENFDEDAQV